MGKGGVRVPAIERFSTGLFIGAVFALALAWVLDAEVSSALKERWVEVFGILAALLAAVVALHGVQRQIRVQTDQAEAERIAQLRASVAVLPLVLSSFVRASENCFEISLADRDEIRDPTNREAFLRAAEISEASLEVLRDCIRFADKVSAGWLSLIVRQYQVCHARFVDHVAGDHMLLELNQYSMGCDWAKLRAVANHLFEFSRGEVDQVLEHLDPNTVGLPISSRHFGHPMYGMAREMLARERDRWGFGSAGEYFG